MSASDARYDAGNQDEEHRVYVPRIFNPWRLTVLGLRGRKLGINWYSFSEDLYVAEDLPEALEEIGRLELPGRRLALKSEPLLRGLTRRYEEVIRATRRSLLHLAQEFD